MMTDAKQGVSKRKELEVLTRIADRLGCLELNLLASNYIAILKETYAIGEISKDEYVGALEEVWNVIKY